MDGFSFDHPSPDLGADILCGTPCSLWSNLQLPWDQSNAGDCADLTDILSGLQYIATDTKAVDAPTEIPPTTLCSMGSTKTDATASYNGWQLHHGQKEGDLTDAMAWLQSEPSVLGDDSRTQAPESQLFSLPLNQLGRLGGEVTALLSNNFGNTVTDLQVNNYNCKRALSAESSAELQCISSESNHLPSKGACNHYHQSFPNSLGNQADGSSTTTTTNSSPNSSVGDVNSIVLADILRWTSRMNTPAPRCGAARDEPKVLPFMDHNPPTSKKPRLLLEEGASYSPSGLDFRRSTVRSSLEPDPEAIAKVKEMIYRAAVMRPVALGRETTAEKPRRRNVKISSDPQTVAARERRERISDRLRVLQRLVPGGSKMDTATMLDEACNYLKFLKTQLAAGSKNHTGQGVKKLGASPSSLSSRYPLAPLQSRPTFPATLETLVNRISSSQFQNPSFPSSRS